VSNTLQGQGQTVPRSSRVINNGRLETLRVTKVINQPNVNRVMFKNFSNIDIHNHLRQDLLAIEQIFETVEWYNKLFSTLLGILSYELEYHGKSSEKFNFQTFVGKLAHQLIFNVLITKVSNPKRKNNYDDNNSGNNKRRSEVI
jgi:hypothetical protein